MPDERWERTQELFHIAAELSDSERLGFLVEQCGSDAAMLAELDCMLRPDLIGFVPLDGGLSLLTAVLESDELPNNDILGPYRLIKALGEGSTGRVYLATRLDVGSLVAIKFLRDAWISSVRRKRFAAEQRIVARLRHHLIASLHDAGVTEDGTPYFVMEYVEGHSLTQYCAGHQCGLRERLELFSKVCEAVRYSHSQAIVHRDIKPSNIQVTRDGMVKLLDFGIARQMETLDEENHRTVTGFRLMTAAYGSPEQWLDKWPGLPADIYSLGVVLFELLTGVLPFDLTNVTASEAQRLVTQEMPAAPSIVSRSKATASTALAGSVKRSEWADLDVMCLKALQKAPERRYSTVDAFLQDVNAFLKGQPLAARRDSWRYRGSKFVLRHRTAVAAAVVALIVVSVITGVFFLRLSRERQAVLAESAKATRLLQFTLDLLGGGQREEGPPSDLRVSELLQRASQRAGNMQGDPLRQSEILMTTAAMFQSMGDLGKASDNIKAASALRRRVPDKGVAFAQSQVALGSVISDQGHLDEAEKDVREGLAILEHFKGEQDPDVLKSKLALGQILITRGYAKDAVRLLEPVVNLQQTSGSSGVDRAQGLFQLATAYEVSGDNDRATQSLNSLLVLDRSLYGLVHPSIAAGEQWLCQMEMDRNALAEAEPHCRTAFSISQAWYGPEASSSMSATRALGALLTKEKKLQEGRLLLLHALSIAEAHTQVPEGVGTALASLAINEYYSGEYEVAEQHYNRSLTIFRTIYGGDHNRNVATVLFRLAEIANKEHNYARAEKLTGQAIAIFAEVQGTEGIKTAEAHAQLGHILKEERKYAEAKKESELGYKILVKQPGLPGEFFEMGKKDLAEEDKKLSSSRADP